MEVTTIGIELAKMCSRCAVYPRLKIRRTVGFSSYRALGKLCMCRFGTHTPREALDHPGPKLAAPCRGRPSGLIRELQLETPKGNPGEDSAGVPKECIDENHLRRSQEYGSLPRWHTT
jgi:hypothetical protein